MFNISKNAWKADKYFLVLDFDSILLMIILVASIDQLNTVAG